MSSRALDLTHSSQASRSFHRHIDMLSLGIAYKARALLSTLRLLRLVSLARYFWGATILVDALQRSQKALTVPFFFLMLMPPSQTRTRNLLMLLAPVRRYPHAYVESELLSHSSHLAPGVCSARP